MDLQQFAEKSGNLSTFKGSIPAPALRTLCQKVKPPKCLGVEEWNKQGIAASQLNRVSWANCCQHLQKACRPILGPCNFTVIGSLESFHSSLELKILQPGSSMSHDSTKQLCNPRGLQRQVSNRKGLYFFVLGFTRKLEIWANFGTSAKDT